MAKSTYPRQVSDTPEPGITVLAAESAEPDLRTFLAADAPEVGAAPVVEAAATAVGKAVDHRPGMGERWRLPDGHVIVIEQVMERHGGAVIRGFADGAWHDLSDATGPLGAHGASEVDPSSGGFLVS